MQCDEKQINYINFEGTSFVEVREIVRRLVHAPVERLYYCKVGSITELKNQEDVEAFLTVGYKCK